MRSLYIFLACIALILLSGRRSFAQGIYSGGNGDGASNASYAQPDNILFNIYSGGTHDGASVSSFAQPDNVLFDIYKGGLNDGFTVSSFAQPDNVLFDIYRGGSDDGFSVSSFAQPDNILYDIYRGGLADGFSWNSFAQPDNVLYDIYQGGFGDGFAFNRLGSVGGEVPLPVELVSFEGRFHEGAVLLTWRTASELNNERFILERSGTGFDFTGVYSVDGSGTSTTPRTYRYEDRRPLDGINYYRLKQIDFDQSHTYSNIIAVSASAAQTPQLMLFPNPSTQQERVQIVIGDMVPGASARVDIRSSSGQTLHTFSTVADGLGRINIEPWLTSVIGPGFYIIVVQLGTGLHTGKWVVR